MEIITENSIQLPCRDCGNDTRISILFGSGGNGHGLRIGGNVYGLRLCIGCLRRLFEGLEDLLQ